jgi:hypothetical protein
MAGTKRTPRLATPTRTKATAPIRRGALARVTHEAMRAPTPDGPEADEVDPSVAVVAVALPSFWEDPDEQVADRDEHAQSVSDVVGDREVCLGAGLGSD